MCQDQSREQASLKAHGAGFGLAITKSFKVASLDLASSINQHGMISVDFGLGQEVSGLDLILDLIFGTSYLSLELEA